MHIPTIIYAGVALTINMYANHYWRRDAKKALAEMETDYGIPRVREWDFIIVGGGTAGCLLAERLSEHFTVLLLEKGGEPVPNTYNGLHMFEVYDIPVINDNYKTMPQEYAFRSHGGMGIMDHGRMLGGSGSHNANTYNRGSPHDYNNWANLTGDPYWKYDRLIPQFKKVEDFHGYLVHENERKEFYGHGGPLSIECYPLRDYVLWTTAANELGYPVIDSNSRQMPGFAAIQHSVRNGVKDSTYTAFIERKARNRPSLRILKYSMASKILIHPHTKEAFGVAYHRHGVPQVARARKEVIIAAGPYPSPALLIKSGVGPQKLLDEAGIPVIKDLPGVGQNLHDHLLVSFTFNISNREAASHWFPIVNNIQALRELIKFNNPSGKRTGLIASTIGISTVAFFASSRAKNSGESDWADIQVNVKPTITVENEVPVLYVEVMMNRPRSKGYLHFNTTAYKKGVWRDTKLLRPDGRELTDQSDVEVFLEGIDFTFKIFEDTNTYKPLGLLYNDPAPEMCKKSGHRTREYWKCYLMYGPLHIGHTTGTCKMGNLHKDKMAVVDTKLRVRGIKMLRVADSSVFPEVTNTNINAAAIIVAQKAASDILLEHLPKKGIPV